ncbi:MAG: hypothetical protein ABL962_10915 [Fimbriimonadaceae bacterium]
MADEIKPTEPEWKGTLAFVTCLVIPHLGAIAAAYMIIIGLSDIYPVAKLLVSLAYVGAIGFTSFILALSLTCAWGHGCL